MIRVQAAKAYVQAGADELVFLDITATIEGRNITLDVVKKVAEEVSIPFIVGGGISSVKDIKKLLNAGANKVSINTAALNNPQLITEASTRFGSNKIIIAIDAGARSDGSGWDVYIKGGTVNSKKDVLEWAIESERLGAGEILLTSIDKDGTKNGYDTELTKKVSESVNIPVIASGGAGTKEHFYQVLTDGKADAALAASLFHFKEIEIGELKRYLRDKGIKV